MRREAARTVGRNLVIAVGVAVVLSGCGRGSTLQATSPTPVATTPTATPPTATPPTATPPTATPPTGTTPTGTTPSATRSPSVGPTSPSPRSSGSSQPASVLRRGDTGGSVRRLQKRLSALGYWLGQADGRYGDLTEQAVVAVQKAAGLPRDGVTGPRTWQSLDAGVRPAVRRTAGSGVEIDLRRQLLILVQDGAVRWVFNTSTGSGTTYWQNGETRVAVTPTGHFVVTRAVDGADVSPLGVLWRPKYFTGGIAIHGYPDVPPYPASHGCVRVTVAAMDFLWSGRLLPIGTSVWVY